MKFMKQLVPFVLSALVIAGCSSTVSTTGVTPAGKYSEDLSTLRPKAETKVDTGKVVAANNQNSQKDHSVYLEPRHSVNQQLDMVLDSIDRINIANGLIDGFTIQLYSGTNRDEALNVKKQVAQAMPDLSADVQFVQPNFRVRAGKYSNRYEAHKDYMAVKRLFPNAIIIPERIPLRLSN